MLISVVINPVSVPELFTQLQEAQQLITEQPGERAIVAQVGLNQSGEVVVNGRLLSTAHTRDFKQFTNGARVHELAIIALAGQLVDLCAKDEAEEPDEVAGTADLVCQLEEVVNRYRKHSALHTEV